MEAETATGEAFALAHVLSVATRDYSSTLQARGASWNKRTVFHFTSVSGKLIIHVSRVVPVSVSMVVAPGGMT